MSVSASPVPAADRGLRGYVIERAPFREIGESVVGVDNLFVPIKAARLGIRYLTRALGYRRAAPVLRVAGALARPFQWGRNARYAGYLIRLNAARVDYLRTLSREDLRGAVRKKAAWAELSIRESQSPLARWTAREFLGLLAQYGMYDRPARRPARRWPAAQRGAPRFYIYGPNASAAPSPAYNDCTIVLTKPSRIAVDAYADRMLFINSTYYRNAVCANANLRAEIIGKYGEIYVSCRQSALAAPFIRSKFSLGDNLASPMALGRVIYNLLDRYGPFEAVIEGFDFYLAATAIQAYYPTAASDDALKREHLICAALADHDALYNFLFVKDLVDRVTLVDSGDFRATIGLSGEAYLTALGRVRRFQLLQ